MKISYLNSLPSLIETIKLNYESFILGTYKLDHAGLFHDKEKVYAVVKNLSESEMSLDEVKDLYNKRYKTLGVPGPVFVESIQDNYVQINLRNSHERINLYGHTFNYLDFKNQIDIAVPSELHPFHVKISWADASFIFIFKNEVSDDTFSEVILICESLGYYGYTYSKIIDSDLPDYALDIDFLKKEQGGVTLLSSSFLKKSIPNLIVEKYEEDEDFWSQKKFDIFTDLSMKRQECLTESFLFNGNSCFVDATVFPRNNIREYLSLYDIVVIAIPLADSPLKRDFYETFRIERFELLELIQRKRVKFVAYQNLHRYDFKFIADLLSVDPDCILFSRRLASASLLEVRKKTGLFGYSFNSETQFKLQRACYFSNSEALKILAETLSHNAAYMEYSLNHKGAMGLSYFGASVFAGNIYKSQGKDYFLELTSSSMSFEFAQGLNAHHFPFDADGYSEVNACKILNGIYNGVQDENEKMRESEVQTLLSDVFAISNDMSVLELDDILSGHGRKKIPAIINEFSELSVEERKYKLYMLNKEIKKIEKRTDKISRMDISGLFSTAAGALMEYKGMPGGAYVALLPWVVKLLSVPFNLLDNREVELLNKLSNLTRGASGNTLLIQKIRKDMN